MNTLHAIDNALTLAHSLSVRTHKHVNFVKCVELFSDVMCNVKSTSAIQYVLTLLSDLTEVRNLCCARVGGALFDLSLIFTDTYLDMRKPTLGTAGPNYLSRNFS